MIIAQISDTHIALDTPDADQRIRDLEVTIADINALDPAPDVIFHTGDIVQNGRNDEYAEAARMLARARAPVYVIPGNRDDRENLRAAFSPRGYLEGGSDFVEYAIEDYPVRLIAVDTLNTNSNKGDFCVERAKRLTDLIAAETSKPIAIFAHHPPFDVKVGPEPLNFETAEMMMRLRQALQHSERVVGIFSGHVHRATAGYVGSIPASVMSSIATTLRWDSYPAHMKTSPVYHVHRLDASGNCSSSARVAGAVAGSAPATSTATSGFALCR